MMLSRMRLYVAGLVAVLMGMPLAGKAEAATDDIVWSSLDLMGAIISAAQNS